MAMNIKNPETERLARELAKRTGESMTVAITVALKERLERQKNPKEGLAAWLKEISKETAPLLKDLPSSDKIGDLLFDKETGLPL
jgi:antitoxin VapB